MESRKPFDKEEGTQTQPLTEDDLGQVAGGHSHARTPVFRARKPIGGQSRVKCEMCGLELRDAGAYFEHKRMVHGG